MQEGLEPAHWRSMPSIGKGVREVKTQTGDGAYRVFYVASFRTAVYVLHAFEKNSQKTPKTDLKLAKKRLQLARDEDARQDH